jgi:hypothetical chaperone protein
MDLALGLDFGTTNSSIALAHPDGAVQVLQFPTSGEPTASYRSLLYLERVRTGARTSTKSWTGPAGIERYLEADEKGRLIQSLKSFLASRNLRTTEVFGRRVALEDLIANILRDVRLEVQRQFPGEVSRIVVGRPIRFVGAESDDDDAYAEGRLAEALRRAGFDSVSFELEPIGAAFYYESNLHRDELILIGDFGGGTSDFSLLRVGPSIRERGRGPEDLLGNEGLGLAGDAFDAKIVRHLVSPALGYGTMLKSFGKILPVPSWVYRKLERWHHLSLLKSTDTMNMLESVRAQALQPERIEALIALVRGDLGYQLHSAVQQVKVRLSQSESATFHFKDPEVDIEARVTRAEFESWISDELHAIEKSVDRLLKRAGVSAAQVDRVFLTGGTSFVPAVRRIFDLRFGHERITTGDEFTSVAHGLALRAL